MKKINFDEYASDYNEIMQNQHKFFGNIDYYSYYKINLTHKVTKPIFKSANKLNIMEYGCGVGKNLPYLKKFFRNSKIFAYDISKRSLEVAKKNNPNCHIIYENNIANYENSFDLIFIAGVYHHIETKLRIAITKNIYALLKRGGLVVIFEHNPYNPLTKHMVNTCAFDKDAILLTKKELINLFITNRFQYLESKYCLFVPPILKKLDFLENILFFVPFGGQYMVVFRK